ncbi:MAG: SGNH/GDSL hydrolase family protein [Clostridia bacterium]|nr:SGNH/GDSL hydrolase family protein [Clostridia bacterium]
MMRKLKIASLFFALAFVFTACGFEKTEKIMNENITTFKEDVLSGKKLKIKLLGDSITHGVGGSGFEQNGESIVAGFSRNPDGYCWAKLFKDYLEENYNCEVLNNACTGTDVGFTINNFNALVDADDDYVICAIGTNNRHQYKVDRVKKSREEFSEVLYGEMVRLADKFKAAGKRVIFIANIPASPENECDGRDYYRILNMGDINSLYKRLQTEKGISLISLYDLFNEYLQNNGMEINSLLCDGLHPNDEGYKVIFDLLKNALGI